MRTWAVALVVFGATVAGCSDSGDGPNNGSTRPALPSTALDRPMAQHRLDKLREFLEKVELLDRVGPEFELRDVDYTSPTDAVAEFLDHRPGANEWGRVIATTDDNWAHSSRLYISDDLADLVDYLPLGRGAVAIKAQDQFPRKSYPPFVLYPDGQLAPLRVVEPRALDEDTELLGLGVYNLFAARLQTTPADVATTDTEEPQGLWAVDVEAAELFPIAGSPLGDVLQDIPGRVGSAMSVRGYRNGVGDGVWRFETTTDAGRSWTRTDVSLPLRRKYLWRYADVTTHAVGPGQRQAIAMSDAPEDLPLYLRELWLTDDEQHFDRVRLPWEPMRFGGMAYASDGALLIAEVGGSDRYCDALVCDRPGRIWRLAPDGTEPTLLPRAPRLFGPFWSVGIDFSGGSIVARTGLRTIALSADGYTWTEVRPGQRDVSSPERMRSTRRGHGSP
jgi:hypothetical protein